MASLSLRLASPVMTDLANIRRETSAAGLAGLQVASTARFGGVFFPL